MKSKLLNWLETLRSSFWLVPAAMAIVAIGLSYGAVALDSGPVGKSMANSLGWLWSGGAEGARSLLSTVASSMITVAGTVFSITIAALTLASSQFGPKLLRNFTQDRGNQVVLGTFIATYTYCLLVLRTVRGQGAGNFVPYLSVTGGLLLALASLAVLIYFIDHVASAIQAEKLIEKVGAELKADIVRIYPEQLPQCAQLQASARRTDIQTVAADRSGYVQAIDRAGLLELAAELDLVLEIVRRPGDFVCGGGTLLLVQEAPGRRVGERSDELRKAFSIGRVRTSSQDVRYGANQLIEIACRALSPGINDPYTAMSCIDWLSDTLATMADRSDLPRTRTGEDGVVRLLEEQVGFGDVLELTLGALRADASGNAMVVAYLLNTLAGLVPQMTSEARRGLLAREAGRIAAAAQMGMTAQADRARVGQALEGVAGALE